jgi:hypothetical protein
MLDTERKPLGKGDFWKEVLERGGRNVIFICILETYAELKWHRSDSGAES